MKRFFTLLFAFILIGNFLYAQNGSGPMVDGVLKVKFKEETTKQFDYLLGKSGSNREIVADQKAGFVQTGIKEIDALNQKYGVVKYTRVFRDAGKNEAKHREFGLHLWYKIEFSTKSDPVSLVREFKSKPSVQHANPEYKAALTGVNNPKTLSSAPNDPKFTDQWHYENTGQNGGTAGADISLLDAWTVETGNSQVIVAIEDAGVDWDHEDLAGNMWVNPGEIPGNGIDDDNNGYVDDIYGYNFGDNKGAIYVGDHGTHVAGTVAAETNNGKGVSGVAGGSGNNDGVRLMSCNVFGQSTGGFDEAFVYAADNGAVISQNSWGYTSKGVYDQAVLDAIDYFIANAGSPSAPMDGGVVIFAAGNDGSSGQWWPGCYEPVVAVAATNKNDEKSYYSNYDTWVDISAPGGELESSNTDPTAIHSTYPNNAYGVMQGTSMACPHVSGVAALIVSHYAGSITPTQLIDKLVSNTDDIDAQNPSYIGKLGSGRLNAYAALTAGSVEDNEAPTAPSNLIASGITGSSVTLNWSASTDNISVKGYRIYRGGTLVNTSTGTSFTVTGLSPLTTYSFYVTAYDAAGNVSGASNTVTATTTEADLVYCTSKGNDFSYEWIAGVAIGDFSNSSSGAAYTDFTSKTVEMTVGTGYNVTLTPGFASSTYNEYWKIWVDLNKDGDFEDANELIFDAGALSKTAVTGTVTIPAGTSAKTTRMRVSMKYNAAQTACETFSYGEVEDYTVNIVESGGDTQAPTAPTNLNATSITQTSFTLNWTASSDNVGVTGYDVYQNGSLLGSVAGTSANISGLTAATTYSYYVKAKDAAGNISVASSSLSVTTASPVDTQAPTAPSNLSSSNIGETSATISWTASTDNVGVTGYDIYRNGSVMASTANTSYNVTGLTASTTYSFYVKAKDAAGNVSAASNTISVTTDDIVAEYCTSKGNNSSYEWIAKVQIGTYSKSSGAAGYTDFTSENISLAAGSAVNIVLTPGFASSTYNEYWKIWIDYNNDKVFDNDELAFDAGSLSKTAVNGTMNIPSNASGTTRMRVSMKYNGAQTACESFSYGEVEDYTVTFTSGGGDTQAPTAPASLAASAITQTSLTLSWNASTDNVGVTAYDVYQNGSLLGSVTGTSANVTGLTASTTYSFYVKAKDAAGNISNASNTINVTTSGEQLTYCSSKGNNSSYEWIDLVQFNEINNTTANNGGYADFTNLVANVNPGSSQTIYISCGFSGSTYTEYWHVWIDWDHSGTFDSDELMVSGSSSSAATLSATFTVPSDAVLGTTRMRVTMKYNAAATACETFSYGEVEDYTVNVTSASGSTYFAETGGTEVLGNELPTEVSVYPNPANDFITVDVVNGTKYGKVSIYNMIGSLVKVVEMTGSERDINIEELPAGSYIISVEDEKGPITKQIIKK